MVLYITEAASYAVVHRTVNDELRPIEVVEVVPRSGEAAWVALSNFYPQDIERAMQEADRLEQADRDAESRLYEWMKAHERFM